jgi:hypothetical protein
VGEVPRLRARVRIHHPSPWRSPPRPARGPGGVPDAKPVALAESIPAMEGQISPGFMRVWSGFFPGQLTGKPVAPAPLEGNTIPVGGSAATLIPVGTTDTEHSSVVHVPVLSLVVSGDAVYNQTHMWLRGRHRTRAPAGCGRWMRWQHSKPGLSSPATAIHRPPTTTRAARSTNAAGTSLTSRRRWSAVPPRPNSSTDDVGPPGPGEPVHALGRGLRSSRPQELTKRDR